MPLLFFSRSLFHSLFLCVYFPLFSQPALLSSPLRLVLPSSLLSVSPQWKGWATKVMTVWLRLTLQNAFAMEAWNKLITHNLCVRKSAFSVTEAWRHVCGMRVKMEGVFGAGRMSKTWCCDFFFLYYLHLWRNAVLFTFYQQNNNTNFNLKSRLNLLIHTKKETISQTTIPTLLNML